MKKNKSLMLLSHFCLIMIFMAIFSSYALSAPIEIKVVTFAPAHLEKVKIQLVMLDKINEQAKGELHMKYLGSRDIMSPRAMGMGVRNGIVDMAILPSSFYSGLIPSAPVWLLSRISTGEERRPGGFFDYQSELHKKVGLFLLGRANPLPKGVYSFNIFTNKKATDISGLAGQKISTTVMGVPFIKALGASPINLPRSDMFPSMQQGIIDGHISAITEVFGLGLHKVSKYMIDAPFSGAGQTIIINPKKWNSTPKHLQDIILKTQLEMEKIWAQQHGGLVKKSYKKLQNAGLEFIEFSSEDKARLFNLFYKSTWEYMIEKAPEQAKRSKELLGG